MPLKNVSQFRVRHYECDAYEHANYASYLRYMQEAAFEATEAAGWTVERMRKVNYHWIARESRIVFHGWLQYGDTVEVTTYLAYFRKIGTRRLYEFRKTDDPQAFAEGYTDWILVDSQTEKPSRIPQDVMDAFIPEGAAEPPAGRDRFPAVDPPGNGVYAASYRVRWPDIDPVRHLNNSEYLAYAEDCSVMELRDAGWPADRIRDSGFAIVAKSHRMEYLQPAVYGDTVEISTWKYDSNAGSYRQYYLFRRPSDGALLARIDSQWAAVALTDWTPCSLPPAFPAGVRCD
ncbi:MAG: hypothetical protein AMXMBFR84_33970 [Candidatus Hydrogenedentota bacterium]